jgi:hypothetical protein
MAGGSKSLTTLIGSATNMADQSIATHGKESCDSGLNLNLEELNELPQKFEFEDTSYAWNPKDKSIEVEFKIRMAPVIKNGGKQLNYYFGYQTIYDFLVKLCELKNLEKEISIEDSGSIQGIRQEIESYEYCEEESSINLKEVIQKDRQFVHSIMNNRDFNTILMKIGYREAFYKILQMISGEKSINDMEKVIDDEIILLSKDIGSQILY